MGHAAAAISLDRFRRRGQASVEAPALAPEPTHPLVGMALGVAERRYGLMTSREIVGIAEVVGTSGDLAVSDRLAFMAAMRHTATPVVVIELDGWFIACIPTHALETADYAALQPAGAAQGAIDARVMSVATARGIMPVLGPLAAV
jgi:hypothetical protein